MRNVVSRARFPVSAQMGMIVLIVLAMQAPEIGAALIAGYTTAKLGFRLERRLSA